MLLYHGSTVAVRKPTVARGRSKTDFGKGFYTTTSLEQATKWANIKKNREGGTARAVVSVFEIDDAVLQSDNFRIMHFGGASEQWLDFVVNNRKGIETHAFDMVMGPVANDKLYATIVLYENGTLTAAAAIEQLKTHQLFDQLSFHSQRACRLLKYIESFEV